MEWLYVYVYGIICTSMDLAFRGKESRTRANELVVPIMQMMISDDILLLFPASKS